MATYEPPRYFDFFANDADFVPNHNAPLKAEIERLAELRGWDVKRIRPEYHSALSTEWRYYTFQRGDDSDELLAFQSLCRDLGVKEEPDIVGCKLALSEVYVSIVDYIDCKRAGKRVKPIYRKWRPFKNYMKRNKEKVFPKFLARQDPILTALLQYLFDKGPM